MNQPLGEIQRRTLDAERQALTTKQREWHERFCRLLKNHELYRDEYAVKLARALVGKRGFAWRARFGRSSSSPRPMGERSPFPRRGQRQLRSDLSRFWRARRRLPALPARIWLPSLGSAFTRQLLLKRADRVLHRQSGGPFVGVGDRNEPANRFGARLDVELNIAAGLELSLGFIRERQPLSCGQHEVYETVLKHAPESWVRSETHGSISGHEGEPVLVALAELAVLPADVATSKCSGQTPG